MNGNESQVYLNQAMGAFFDQLAARGYMPLPGDAGQAMVQLPPPGQVAPPFALNPAQMAQLRQMNPALAGILGGLLGGAGFQALAPKTEPPTGWPGTTAATGNAAAADNFTPTVGANAGAGSSIAALTTFVTGGNLSTRRRSVWRLTHAGVPALGEQAILTLPTNMRDLLGSLVGRELPHVGIEPLNANAANSGLSAMLTLDAGGTLLASVIVRASVAPAVGASDFLVMLGDQD